jgi:hypothetical protein
MTEKSMKWRRITAADRQDRNTLLAVCYSIRGINSEWGAWRFRNFDNGAFIADENEGRRIMVCEIAMPTHADYEADVAEGASP